MTPTYRLFPELKINSPLPSPDGKNLAFLSEVDGVSNLWVGGIHPDAKPLALTHSERAIRLFFWAWNSHQLVYKVDPAGDERYQFFAVDILSGTETALTPEFGEDGHRVATWGEGFFLSNDSDPAFPDEFVVLTDERVAGRNDVWKVNLLTAERMLLQTGRQDAQRWLIDNELAVRGFIRGDELGATSMWLRDSDSGEFTERLRFEAGDFTHYTQFEFSDGNEAVYLLDATGRDKKALVRMDLGSLQRETIAAHDDVDAQGFAFDPRRHIPLSVEFYTGRLERRVLDSDYAALLDLASSNRDEDIHIRHVPGSGVIMAYYSSSTSPPSTMLFDVESQRGYLLGQERQADNGQEYCEMQPLVLTARDGLRLHGYLTLPKDYLQPGPLVLLVHGGPNERDYWGFNPLVQNIAAWGYACLQVDFRGSSGYGKEFLAAGNAQWGRAMQNDLTDAVAWAVEEGIADATRVAIIGESYGGYAVLAGLTLTPEVYAAGVALNPVCDLEAQARHWDQIRPAWRAQFDLQYGALPRYTDGEHAGEIKGEADWDTADRALIEALRQYSPTTWTERVRVPLLIAKGAADSRVLEVDTRRFVEACRANGADIEYIVFEGEGHWLAKPEHYEEYYDRAEELLNRTIGEARSAHGD